MNRLSRSPRYTGRTRVKPRQDLEAQSAVGFSEMIEGVDEQVRLADPDRDGEDDLAPDAVDNRLGAAGRVCEMRGHTPNLPSLAQVRSASVRQPSFPGSVAALPAYFSRTAFRPGP